jgi:hypothetical protein
MNAIAERWIGGCRELLDRPLIRLRGTVTPDGRQPDRYLAGEPSADALS